MSRRRDGGIGTRRRVVGAVLTLALGAIVVVGFHALAGGRSRARRTQGPPRGAVRTAASRTQGMLAGRRRPLGAPRRGARADACGPSIAAARTTIGKVVGVVESYGWDRTPAGQVTRIRSLLTPSLAQQLATARVPPAEEARWRRTHYEGDASVAGIQVRSCHPGRVQASVLYEITGHPAGQGDGLLSATTLQRGRRWVVSALGPYRPPLTGR